jgi:glucosylceramidase
VHAGCHKGATGSIIAGPPTVTSSDVEMWLTNADQSALLQKQPVTLSFGTGSNTWSFIDVDTAQTFQTIDGFGFTLTGGSASLINQLRASDKGNLLRELFANDASSIGISYLRISIGASDLNAAVFSYDDMPSGETDTSLSDFNLGPDETSLIPLLK